MILAWCPQSRRKDSAASAFSVQRVPPSSGRVWAQTKRCQKVQYLAHGGADTAAPGFIAILNWLIPRHYHLLGQDDFPNPEIHNFSDSIWSGLLSVICESEGRWKPSWLKLAKKVKENNVQGGVSCWVSGADPVPPTVAGDSLNFFFNSLCLSKETQNSLFWQNRPVHVPEPPTVLGVETSHSVSKYAEMLA